MNKSTQAIAYILLCMCVKTHAGQDHIEKSGNEFELALDTRYGYIDNYLLTPNNEESNNFWQISPSLFFQVQSKHQQFSLGANARHVKFSDFSQDDHTDVNLSPSYQYKWSVNQGIYANMNWQSASEQRGTGLSIGYGAAIDELDEKESTGGIIGYQYGNDESIAKLSFELGYQAQQYTTRRSQSKLLDQQKRSGRVFFDYLYGTTTYLTSELSLERVQFKHQPLFDKDKSTVLVGVKWPLSVINQFEFLIGYQQVAFDESLFKDDSSVKWRLNWQWSPQPSMSLSISSNRDFAEANRLVNSYRLVDRHQLRLSKQLNDRVTLDGSIGYTQQDVYFEQLKTTEDYIESELTAGYQLNSRANLYLALQYRDLSASQQYLEHQRANISFGVKVSL